jgi:putative transcriptional regulator
MGRSLEPKVQGETEGRTDAARDRSAPDAPGPLSPAGAKIVAAFEEALAALRSGAPPEARFTVRTYRVDFTPRAYGPDDVRRVRGLLGMSQTVFAHFLGVGATTVRAWEQGSRPPSPLARRFLEEIEAAPEHWRRRTLERAAGVDAGAASV